MTKKERTTNETPNEQDKSYVQMRQHDPVYSNEFIYCVFLCPFSPVGQSLLSKKEPSLIAVGFSRANIFADAH